jgi:hypothetical protein
MTQRMTLAPEQITDVGLALLTLAHEVHVLADRQRTLEAVLAKHGIDAAAEIEAFTPDPAFAAAQAGRAKAMVARLVGALAGVAPQNPAE